MKEPNLYMYFSLRYKAFVNKNLIAYYLLHIIKFYYNYYKYNDRINENLSNRLQCENNKN